MVQKLVGPVKKFTSGAFPSHSEGEVLASNFENLDQHALMFILVSDGFMTTSGRPTKRAAGVGLVELAEATALWNLTKLEEHLKSKGDQVTRKAVNQEIKLAPTSGPVWVNLGTVGSYFSVSANEVGKWLDKLELRDENNMATTEAIERGLATIVEMATGQGKNQTRKINHWNLHEVQRLLLDAGHYLDFNYEASLKGRGRNSDVKVETVDDRAKAFAKEFSAIFKDKTKRRELPELVRRTSKPIVKRAEEILGRPGFISTEVYLKYIDRM